MDVLSQVVMSLREGDAFLRRTRRRGHWANRFGPYTGAGFHVLLEGACWFSLGAGHSIRLSAGDVVFLPRGTVHAMGAGRQPPLATLPHEYTDGPDLGDGTPDGSEAVLLCGAYELRRRSGQALLDAMPDYVHFPGAGRAMTHTTSLIAWEQPGGRIGDQAVRSAVLDLFLVDILRRWIDGHSPGLSSAGAADSGIVTVLRHIHEAPNRQWTVDQMAALANLSRSTFARRFAATVGMPPLRYLGWWRLHIAARRLRQTDVPLAVIAGEVGYGSEFALAHAFKREFGVATGTFRRTPSLADREHYQS
ncbi:AraC family transcriptional regulator [Actinoplanes couchii]|uniref:AraC family transcriptional regulator n=1 Tax=Actinoplanes couchii TaxID=403638 RepID=A0ABQ3XEY2_9ACTN|nr:AraC family transcriptional regulator [Actinoplanes couchii]MDR6319933.1 AraC-like DNA-binding protein [Actinoplanes couchii]GID57070.1 AraC family transcriptional regulator [Actinoplanes couchii]